MRRSSNFLNQQFMNYVSYLLISFFTFIFLKLHQSIFVIIFSKKNLTKKLNPFFDSEERLGKNNLL